MNSLFYLSIMISYNDTFQQQKQKKNNTNQENIFFINVHIFV